MAVPRGNPFSSSTLQTILGTGVPRAELGGGQQYGFNPFGLGYMGYQGFGPSPFSFGYGPYGFGSYGYQPGAVMGGFTNPSLSGLFDTVGRSAGSFALT